MKNKTALVTGVNGYIGSHTAKALYDAGFKVTGVDIEDSPNAKPVRKYLTHYDIHDAALWVGRYDVVVHCAGYISVAESMTNPAKYYDTNLHKTMEVLKNVDCEHFIFASTAGAFDPISPYAKSKVAAEDVIKQLAKNYTIFRFFNVAGSGGEFRQIGESTHIIRVAAEVAAGKRDKMVIFGDDYTTRDGTCVRDYIHVVDLADAIKNAALNKPKNQAYECLGSGKGFTNAEVCDIMKQCTNDFKIEYGPRRVGDPATLCVDNKSEYLQIKYDLSDMCLSAYQMELK